MWRRRSSDRVSGPPVGGVPRGVHSLGTRQIPPVADAGPRHLRHVPPARGRRKIRPGAFFGVAAVGLAVIGLVVALTAGSSPPRPHVSRNLSTTSTLPMLNTISPTTVSTTPTTTSPSIHQTTTSTSIPLTSTSTSSPATSSVAVTASVSPSEVLVEVLNGVGSPHVARRAARALKALGFLINGTGNAAAFDYSRNVIEYRPGSLASAETVARYVSGASLFRRMSSLQTNEVWVTLGATYDGVVN